MTILQKYIIREILTLFVIVLGSVTFIYLAIDFFEKMDKFLEAGQSLTRALTYLGLKIPLILTQTMPAVFLLAILFCLGVMNRNNEILALKCGGISPLLILKPLLLLGFFFTGIMFVLAEGLVPQTMSQANRIWYQEVRQERTVALSQSDIWIRGPQSITYIQHYVPPQEKIFQVSHHIFDEQFEMVRRLDASEAVYDGTHWVLYQVLEQVTEADKQSLKTHTHEQLTLVLDFTPADLRRVVKDPEEMDFRELLELARKVESDGYDATVHWVNVFAKTAYPFICVIMSLLGMGVALKANLREGLAMSITYGIGTAFFYWVFYSFCLSLGYGGILPPLLAAWSANAVFMSLGVLLILNLY